MSDKIELVECDACPTSGGCVSTCMKAAPAAKHPLTVWEGAMPESNGKSNFTVILHTGDISEGICVYRSEYPDRARYEADCFRHLIGDPAFPEKPFILDYDTDKHSGYVKPQRQPDPIISVLKSNLADGVMPSFSGGDLKHLIRLLEAPPELAELQALSVTNIMLDIVPGDGSGHEVYAKSVADVEAALTKRCDEIEELQATITQLRQRLEGLAEGARSKAAVLASGSPTSKYYSPVGILKALAEEAERGAKE